MGTIVKVGMADLNVVTAPDGLTTLGLGSCVGVAVWDPVSKVGGLLHAMLPDSTSIRQSHCAEKFVDTGLDLLVDKMVKAGASRTRLQAKIAGGAQMFGTGSNSASDIMKVGERNVTAAKDKLSKMKIKLLAEDTGKNYGRTVIFFPETGEYVIKAVGKPESKI